MRPVLTFGGILVTFVATSLAFSAFASMLGNWGKPLEILSAITSAGSIVTAAASIVIAFVAWDVAAKFNKAQALKFRVEHTNDFNREILALAQADRSAAEKIGRKVLPESDIVADYINFMMLNSAHVEWRFTQLGFGEANISESHLRNTAQFLVRFGIPYCKAILKRGYTEAFADEMLRLIEALDGNPSIGG